LIPRPERDAAERAVAESARLTFSGEDAKVEEHVSDLYDDERSPIEGVRILGAEEARASLGAKRPADEEVDAEPEDEALLVDLADDEEQLDLRVDEMDDEPLVASRKESATWSALGPDDILPGREAASERPISSGPSAPTPPVPSGDPPTGEVPKLPHWTEPPTGAVPAIFADDSDPDDLDAWASVTGAAPRFRAEGSDWAESDFADDLSEQPGKLGAIGDETPVDEEEQFARDLDAKRSPRRVRAARATARPPRAEPDAATQQPSAPRDLPTAIMTAAAVAVVAIICFTRVWTTVALAAVIIGVATLELASSLQKRGLRPATLVALVACTMMPIAAYNYGTESYPVFFALVTIVSMLWFLWEITPGRPLPSVASTLLVFAYVGGLGGFAGLLLAGNDGVGLILGVALCVIAYDVVGFFVGSQFGHTAIAPKVSPNKTVEGTIAGMVAAVLVGAVVAGQIAPWTPGKGAVLGVLAAIGAFVGDLCESMLKRDLGLKDFGSLLPGHGGVLDRFDSLLFCLPIAYYLALQFKIF
jgi:phosphatidate cytidylyltransferase